MPCVSGVGVRRFEEFRAWQLAVALRDKVLAVTATPPFKRDLRFRDSLSGAACSAPRLIAEGFFSPARVPAIRGDGTRGAHRSSERSAGPSGTPVVQSERNGGP